MRKQHLLRFDYLTVDGRRPEPHDTDFIPPTQVEPHHLLTWAGRWYLVGYALAEEVWRIYRLDRIRPTATTGARSDAGNYPSPTSPAT